MFTLSNHFLVAAEQKAYDGVNRRLASKVMHLFEEKLSGLNEDEVVNYVIRKRGTCFQLGIYTERGILGPLSLELLLGEEFCNSYLVNMLQNADNGDEIIDVFLKAVTDSL